MARQTAFGGGRGKGIPALVLGSLKPCWPDSSISSAGVLRRFNRDQAILQSVADNLIPFDFAGKFGRTPGPHGNLINSRDFPNGQFIFPRQGDPISQEVKGSK